MNAEVSTAGLGAGLGARLGARLIDGLLVAPVIVVAQVIGLATDGAAGAVIGLVLYLAAIGFAFYNQVVRVGRTGHSFGKQWLSLRVVDERSGAAIGVGRALAREVVLGLLAAVCLVPAIVNLFVAAKDTRRQGWHDKVAASLVASTGPGQDVGPADDESVPASRPAGAPPPLPYAPASPPPAPGTTTPPPAVADEAGSETISRDSTAPSTRMVGPPPGVMPPPPGPSPDEVRAEEPPAEALPVEETVMGPRAGASPTADPVPAAGVEWTISAPDGSSRVIAGPVLVGRDPDPVLVGGADVWAIDDPGLTMSKTHALLGIEDGTAWVEDWHSTNGVALHRGEAQLVIEPHARTPLRDGDVIEFGAFKVTVEATS